jgi:hypothetical protein
MATIYYFLYNTIDFNIQETTIVFLQITIITILLPLSIFFLLRATGMVDSIMISSASQRKIPLAIHCFLILVLLRKSITIENYSELHFFLLGALLSTILALLMLFIKIKASLHMISISALTVFVYGLNIHNQTNSIFTVPFLILMTGFVASSRLEMNAHTPKELIIGLLIGTIPQLILLFFWL